MGRSVPCEYKLEPKVKMPLNPAFGLGPHADTSGCLDVLPLQKHQGLDFDSNFDAQSSSVRTLEMLVNVSSSSSAGTSRDGASDATMDLTSQCLYDGIQYYQHWGEDATWMSGMMMDDGAVDPAWAMSAMNPMGSPSAHAYDEQAVMAYYATQQGFQQFEYAHGGRCHSKSLSY